MTKIHDDYVPSIFQEIRSNDTKESVPLDATATILKRFIRSSPKRFLFSDPVRHSTKDAAGYDDEDDETAVLHIVKTRFMQEQGHLLELSKARLALFRVFCLPTMAQQTQQNFIWIIKIDPLLHGTTILHQLITFVQQHMIYNNTYIVASNTNFRVNEKFPGAWRDGAETYDLMQARVYSGNRTRLQYAMALYDAPIPILETRLDADDGLHVQFIETVQRTAIRTFQQNPHVQWMYWCSRRHMEWHWTDPITQNQQQLQQTISTTTTVHEKGKKVPGQPLSKSLSKMLYDYGTLQGVTHTNLCITPGITTGFAIGTRESDVPVFAHDELVKKIKNVNTGGNTTVVEDGAKNHHPGCGFANHADCLQFVETFVFEAIRSRSPTSAGMLNIQADAPYDTWWVHYVFWNMLHESFGITRQNIQWIQSYLTLHLIDIARDNLLGQCTTGHSCKVSAKQELEQLILTRKALVHQ
jgi:Putative rhamnosyl transferase